MNVVKRKENDEKMVLTNLKRFIRYYNIKIENNDKIKSQDVYDEFIKYYSQNKTYFYQKEKRNSYNMDKWMHSESYKLLSAFRCNTYCNKKIIVIKKKVYKCDDECNNCFLCTYGYTIETKKEVDDPSVLIVDTTNMRKDLFCRELISMIFLRFKVPKDIRKYIHSFLFLS